ncbi:hypothetical protein CLOP_g2214 [Closterium sp. NIES-67]|nr:hypothetical protein CLOP_g2214 [Closterium sp. NIES-67]
MATPPLAGQAAALLVSSLAIASQALLGALHLLLSAFLLHVASVAASAASLCISPLSSLFRASRSTASPAKATSPSDSRNGSPHEPLLSADAAAAAGSVSGDGGGGGGGSGGGGSKEQQTDNGEPCNNSGQEYPPLLLYGGHVAHHRSQPTAHGFNYSVRYALVNLDAAPDWFVRSSGRHHMSADEARSFAGTDGPIFLLTNPVSMGYEQNPISVYYCYHGSSTSSTPSSTSNGGGSCSKSSKSSKSEAQQPARALLPPAERALLPPAERALLPPAERALLPPAERALLPPAERALLPPAERALLPPAERALLPPAERALLPPAERALLPPAERALLPPAERALLPPAERALLPPAERALLPPAERALLPPAERALLPPAERALLPPAERALLPPAERALLPPAERALLPPAESLAICIGEVSNTPWTDRVTFLFAPLLDRVPKPLHVSPFMDMQSTWEMRALPPSHRISLHITALHPVLGNQQGKTGGDACKEARKETGEAEVGNGEENETETNGSSNGGGRSSGGSGNISSSRLGSSVFIACLDIDCLPADKQPYLQPNLPPFHAHPAASPPSSSAPSSVAPHSFPPSCASSRFPFPWRPLAEWHREVRCRWFLCFMPHLVAFWIYWQAFLLWLKGVPLFEHPKYAEGSAYAESTLDRLSTVAYIGQITSTTTAKNGGTASHALLASSNQCPFKWRNASKWPWN